MSNSNHIIVYPIANLKLDVSIKQQLWIENVHIIDKILLSRNIKKYGFPWTFYELKAILKNKPQADIKFKHIKEIFRQDGEYKNIKTYALIRVAGDDQKSISEGFARFRDILYLLASSQFGNKFRGNIIRFGSPENVAMILDRYLLIPSTKGESLYRASVWRTSPVRHYVLGQRWKELTRSHFFPSLLKILNKEINVNSNWRLDLKKAAILAGRSVLSKEIPLSFLYNMIAIETILKKQGESYEKVVPERLNFIFGWLYNDKPRGYEIIKNRISHLYSLRNKFVHDGQMLNVEIEDLLETDYILSNLLSNFCRLTKYFINKETVINLCGRAEAKRFLGLKIKRFKGLRSLRQQYTLRHLTKIKEKGI